MKPEDLKVGIVLENIDFKAYVNVDKMNIEKKFGVYFYEKDILE